MMERTVEVFDTFYQREYEGQVRRAFLLLGVRADAEEVVGDAFSAVFQRWDAISEAGPYLNRCVLNGCRDRAKRRTHHTAERIAEMPDRAGNATEAVEVADLLLRLPFRQRAAIVLRYYGHQTEDEIAEALGCRPGTVGPLIHRALARLRGALE